MVSCKSDVTPFPVQESRPIENDISERRISMIHPYARSDDVSVGGYFTPVGPVEGYLSPIRNSMAEQEIRI